jgi:hypothetical protein
MVFLLADCKRACIENDDWRDSFAFFMGDGVVFTGGGGGGEVPSRDKKTALHKRVETQEREEGGIGGVSPGLSVGFFDGVRSFLLKGLEGRRVAFLILCWVNNGT